MSLRYFLSAGIVTLTVAVVPLFSPGYAREDLVDGVLLYSSGDGAIKAIDLTSSGSPDLILYENPDVSIDSLVRLDGGEIIFGECRGDDGCQLRTVRPGTSATTLRTGHLISYLPRNNNLFFYDVTESGETWLFVAQIDSLMNAHKVARKPTPKVLNNGIQLDMAVAPVPVSESEVVFVGDDGHLWVYKTVDRSIVPLNVGSCYPYIWILSEERLLCSELDSEAPYTLDIFTGDRRNISSLDDGYGFVYLPGQNAIVYGKSRLSWLLHEASDLYVYFLESGISERLKKNVHLRYGVWFDSW